MTHLTQRAVHASFWSALEIVSRYGVQFFVTIALARILSPADFGLMAMLLVFTALATLLAEGGLGSALVQKQNTNADDETSVFLVNLGFSLLLSGALMLMAQSIASFYMQPSLVPLLHTLVWALPLTAVVAVPNAILAKRLDFRSRAKAECVASILSGALALWLAVRGHGVWSLVWQAVVGAGIRAVLLWVLSGWRPRGRFDRLAFTELFRFGGPLLLANVMSLASTRLQSLLIGRLFDAKSLGFYVLAQDTQQAPAQFMTSLLNRVGLPMFSTVAEQPVKLVGAIRLSLRLSMFVFAPCMIGLAIVAESLVTVLYGPTWAPSAPLLSVLALAALFWPLHVLNLAAISARGRSDLVLRLEIIKALVSIPLILMAAPHGMLAVALAVLVSNFAFVGINTWYSHALFGCGFRTQLRDVIPVVLLSVAAAGGAWLTLDQAVRYSIGAGLFAAVVMAVVIYIGGAFAFKMQAWNDVVIFVQALRTRSTDVHRGDAS